MAEGRFFMSRRRFLALSAGAAGNLEDGRLKHGRHPGPRDLFSAEEERPCTTLAPLR
jgi:hypothetical protein